jgi:hypothetical protein
LASVFELAMAASTRSWHLDDTGAWRREGHEDMQLELTRRMADRNA